MNSTVEKTEIAQVNQNQPMIAGESQAVLSMIERVVLNPEADMDKLDKMLDMQERILNRNAKQAYTADLAAMQTKLPLVAKKGKGYNEATYAKLEDINEAIRPALEAHGFAVTFRIKQAEKFVTITAILSHKLGHSEETDIVLPLDTTGNKSMVQAAGSTISYGKRYAIGALLNISTGDDTDGADPTGEDEKKPRGPQPISDDRLKKAIAAINNDEYTIKQLHKTHKLTSKQVKTLNEGLK